MKNYSTMEQTELELELIGIIKCNYDKGIALLDDNFKLKRKTMGEEIENIDDMICILRHIKTLPDFKKYFGEKNYRVEGEKSMNMKPSFRQCEVARVMTKSQATNEQITKELASMTTAEWYKQCKILDNFLIAHNIPLDKGWDLMCVDFYNIASANDVNEATLFVAYMDWLQTQKREE